MNKKLISLLAVMAPTLLLITPSCLSPEETEERTFEMEMAELNELLTRLESEGYDIDTTQSGVYYVVTEPGAGPHPTTGDTVFVEYVGYFTNGTPFDASINHWDDGIWEFVYPEEDAIQGFNDAVAVTQKGALIDAFIPSNLAYGAQGASLVPPYTTLLFSIKLHDLKKASE